MVPCYNERVDLFVFLFVVLICVGLFDFGGIHPKVHAMTRYIFSVLYCYWFIYKL